MWLAHLAVLSIGSVKRGAPPQFDSTPLTFEGRDPIVTAKGFLRDGSIIFWNSRAGAEARNYRVARNGLTYSFSIEYEGRPIGFAYRVEHGMLTGVTPEGVGVGFDGTVWTRLTPPATRTDHVSVDGDGRAVAPLKTKGDVWQWALLKNAKPVAYLPSQSIGFDGPGIVTVRNQSIEVIDSTLRKLAGPFGVDCFEAVFEFTSDTGIVGYHDNAEVRPERFSYTRFLSLRGANVDGLNRLALINCCTGCHGWIGGSVYKGPRMPNVNFNLSRAALVIDGMLYELSQLCDIKDLVSVGAIGDDGRVVAKNTRNQWFLLTPRK